MRNAFVQCTMHLLNKRDHEPVHALPGHPKTTLTICIEAAEHLVNSCNFESGFRVYGLGCRVWGYELGVMRKGWLGR